MTANLAFTVPGSGTSKPSGTAQFGDKFFVCYEDCRPFYLTPGPAAQVLKGYLCGIKPPTAGPTVANSVTGATNLTAGQTVYVAYAFYARGRIVYSQMSPETSWTIATPAKKLTISGFQDPRDDASDCDIDAIAVCVQQGVNNGKMHLAPAMLIDVTDGDFTGKSLTFDTSGAQAELGFNFSNADDFFIIPPAVKYVAKLGERIWFGGQRARVEVAGATVAMAVAQSFRGKTLAKITITTGTFDDSLMWMSLFINGGYVGDVFDVNPNGATPTVLYLDRDQPAAITSTDDFYFLGYNDRLYPSAYMNYTPGNIPTTFAECTNVLQRQLLIAALDEGRFLQGLKLVRDSLNVIFQDTIVQLTGGSEVNTPAPFLSSAYGKTGTVATRSISVSSDGELAFWGQEGPILANTAQLRDVAEDLHCNKLSQGAPWIALADIPTLVATYSRVAQGIVFGNITINGDANWWGLLALQPQYGIFLFSGQEITSNILEYPDTNGQGVILAGDAFNARVKRLLAPTSFVDLAAAADTTAAYTCAWRGGWQGPSKGQWFSNCLVRFPRIIIPGTTIALTINHWQSNYPFRAEEDLAAAQKTTKTVDKTAIPFNDIPLAPGRVRFQSLEITYPSTSGLSADGERPAEIAGYVIIEQNERGGID